MKIPQDYRPTQTPVALITGGARRVGLALTKALHKAGYRVIIHHHSTSVTALLDALNKARPASAFALQADLNSTEGLEQFATRTLECFGRLDVLINNASSFYPTPIGETTQEHWEDLINTNLKAPFFLSQLLTPELRATQGCILNLADIYAERPMKNHTIYSVAKAGMRMLTQSLALELAPQIRVNAIAPGAILWPEGKTITPSESTEKLKSIPMGTLGGTQPIVDTALHLISHAPYTTGQIVAVDGGKSLVL